MGAPKGNTNALKHGLYAKHFSGEEQAGLRNMSTEDFRHEIHMMRVAITNVFEMQAELRKAIQTIHGAEDTEMIEALAKITNSLALAVTALSTVARTHALINGKDEAVSDALEQALNSLPIFLDEKYLIESKADAEDFIEIVVE
jgi:hypothetical protein